MSLPPEKIGDKGQRYAISYILPDGTEFGIGYANDPDAFKDACDQWPKLKGAKRKVIDRQILDTRAKQILQHAQEHAAGLLAMYQVRGYKPGEYVQGLPTYATEPEYEFFKNISGDTAVINFTFVEYMAYLTAVDELLKAQGYETRPVLITKAEFDQYMTKQEGA